MLLVVEVLVTVSVDGVRVNTNVKKYVAVLLIVVVIGCGILIVVLIVVMAVPVTVVVMLPGDARPVALNKAATATARIRPEVTILPMRPRRFVIRSDHPPEWPQKVGHTIRYF